MRHPVRRAPLRSLGLAALTACALALLAPRHGEARGGGPAADPNQQYGAHLFDQCVAWVSRGSQGVTQTNDFYIHVTAELDLDTTRHQGPMRLWWKAPDKFRQELTTRGQTTTKILSGDLMWIVHPNGHVQRMHGTAEGASAVRQLKEDRDRMSDLAQFITLGSLKGPTVAFVFAGQKSGSGSFAGEWLKVSRTAPGATPMHFWLAYDRDGAGNLSAKWPGIVRIDGDPRRGLPTEDFVLRAWTDNPPDQPRAFRYPREIEAFSRQPGRPAVRFLKATVEDIKINTGIPDGRFTPPQPR